MSGICAALGPLALQHGTFPTKLYEMVGVAAEQGVCTWTSNGFIILDRERLCTRLLPLYFRHDRMDSFQRQLNMCVPGAPTGRGRAITRAPNSRRAGARRARRVRARGWLAGAPSSESCALGFRGRGTVRVGPSRGF